MEKLERKEGKIEEKESAKLRDKLEVEKYAMEYALSHSIKKGLNAISARASDPEQKKMIGNLFKRLDLIAYGLWEETPSKEFEKEEISATYGVVKALDNTFLFEKPFPREQGVIILEEALPIIQEKVAIERTGNYRSNNLPEIVVTALKEIIDEEVKKIKINENSIEVIRLSGENENKEVIDIGQAFQKQKEKGSVLLMPYFIDRAFKNSDWKITSSERGERFIISKQERS